MEKIPQIIELIFNLSCALVVLGWIMWNSIKKWKNNPHNLFIIISISLLLIALLIWTGISPLNKTFIRNLVNSFGVLAPLAFILLQILQVIIPPIDHTVIGIMGGLLFGFYYGFLYNLIGRVIGSLIAYYIANKYGKKFITNIVSQKDLDKYSTLWNKNKFLIFLMYFLPFFPDDILSYLAGFTSIPFWSFFIIVLLGHIGGSYALAWTGNGLSSTNLLIYILAIITIIFVILLPIFLNKKNKVI